VLTLRPRDHLHNPKQKAFVWFHHQAAEGDVVGYGLLLGLPPYVINSPGKKPRRFV
jgi:hypothetical protein